MRAICGTVIKETNHDGRKTVAGEKVNFFIYYIVDDDISQAQRQPEF